MLGVRRLDLYLQFDRPMAADELSEIRALVKQRGEHVPVAYLLGTWGFHALDFAVDSRVLVPRPETEQLVDLAIEHLAPLDSPLFVDVGTGSGCIAISVLHAVPHARALATDVSRDALAVARENANTHGVQDRLHLLAGDLLAPITAKLGERRVDAVLSNPPYIVRGDPSLEEGVAKHEPESALYVDGDDPLALTRRLVHEAHEILAPGGLIAIELGAGSGEAAAPLLAEAGYGEVEVDPDLAGIPRVLRGRKAATRTPA